MEIGDVNNLIQIYKYQMSFHSPQFIFSNFEEWKKSFIEDIDGEGRTLFKELFVKAIYKDTSLVGFIQYGKTAFGFLETGDISFDVSYNVIRNIYFDENRLDVGNALIKHAINYFNEDEKVYAFFHYFGMSCFARHGKLFEKYEHIEKALINNGFEIEHENVYYSSRLFESEKEDIVLKPQKLTLGNQQYFDFLIDDKHVGGCEIYYVNQKAAYLRWIYINGDIVGKGIGSKCMKALKSYFFEKGINRFDTDTALSNNVAQHFYEKNNFIKEGITKSYYKL